MSNGSLNKVALMGNLGKDPEVTQTKNGSTVCKFSVATQERVKDKFGKYTTVPEWHNIVVYGNQADNCATYLAKGSKVFIEGKLKTDVWTKQDGQKGYNTHIVAFNVIFLTFQEKENSNSYDNNKLAQCYKESQQADDDDDDDKYKLSS